jgi:hypothetical protein
MANSLTSPFYVPALIVALVVIPFLKDRADRKRITRQIEANGGTVGNYKGLDFRKPL